MSKTVYPLIRQNIWWKNDFSLETQPVFQEISLSQGKCQVTQQFRNYKLISKKLTISAEDECKTNAVLTRKHASDTLLITNIQYIKTVTRFILEQDVECNNLK